MISNKTFIMKTLTNMTLTNDKKNKIESNKKNMLN